MNLMGLTGRTRDAVVRIDLGSLWREAETLGTVERLGRPFLGDRRMYEAVIRVGEVTSTHAEVKAVGATPEAALEEAIGNARMLASALGAVKR